MSFGYILRGSIWAMKYSFARAENVAQGLDGTFVNRLRERRRQEYSNHFDTTFEPRHFLFLFFSLEG
jgi:hypothetical protein